MRKLRRNNYCRLTFPKILEKFFGNVSKIRETLKKFFKKLGRNIGILRTNLWNILGKIVQNIFGIIFGKTYKKL